MTAVQRSRLINAVKSVRVGGGPCLYWMSRDQRPDDNWALIRAAEIAREQHVPLAVVFALTRCYPGATLRSYDFMIRGLECVARTLRERHIDFRLIKVDGGGIGTAVAHHAEQLRACAVVTDFSPLTHRTVWNAEASKLLECPLIEVDAHNIVPVWVASDRQETAARTFRPRINRLLPQYLNEFPKEWWHGLAVRDIKQSSSTAPQSTKEWGELLQWIDVSDEVPPVDWLVPGPQGAKALLEDFIANRLKKYDTERNDPSLDGTSRISAHLHFGHISAQRVALEVRDTSKAAAAANGSFLEELIVRRELSDNFCYYNPLYTKVQGFSRWAQETLQKHAVDKRDYVYTLDQFEGAKTHDELWNAAQKQMVQRGHMHGFMRMYWCKKILEWTSHAQEALDIAIYLNDKYSLDGRDPNGYVGIAWSIGGVHDMGWTERPIFGKVRFMNYNGCKRKFNISKYEEYVKRTPLKTSTSLEKLLQKSQKAALSARALRTPSVSPSSPQKRKRQ